MIVFLFHTLITIFLYCQILLGANDVYVVRQVQDDGRETGKEILIPAIRQCILDVNIEEKKMTVHLLEGLLDI